MLIGNGGNAGIGGTGPTAGDTGAGGISGLLLGADGFNAPASASPLHTLKQQALAAINAPTQTLTGRPLIGNGTPGAVGSEDLLGGLLLLFVVVGVANQPVTHPVQHVHDVAKRLIHLGHGV